MYKNNFLASILVNGNERREYLSENHRKEVYIPLNSEYEILLRNNNNKRAKAVIAIDGMNICSNDSGFIVDANSSMRIERFINDLDSGKKFKLVSSDHEDVQNPNSKENGIIIVKWYFEKENSYLNMRRLREQIDQLNSNNKKYISTAPLQPLYQKLTWYQDYYIGTDMGNQPMMYSCNNPAMSSYIHRLDSDNNNVATIEGSKSNQKFIEESAEFESFSSAAMSFKLMSTSKKQTAINKSFLKMNYCPNCGSSLVGVRFCCNCGKYLTIYQNK